MPELAEVESVRRHVEKALKGKRIRSAAPDLGDRIVFDRAAPEEVRDALEGACVRGTGRRGKYFWLELDRRPWPVFHLGMSGNVSIKRRSKGHAPTWGGQKLWRERNRDASRVLWFCRLLITAEDGTEVAITDPRRFGRIRLALDPLKEAPIAGLGRDPLDPAFASTAQLQALFARRRGPIKTLLLDQKHFAGVGNWLADEILFHARLSPHRPAAGLRPEEIRRLRAKTLAVIRRAVAVGADYERFPRGWLFHVRWGKSKTAKVRGHAIRHDEIGGRTAAWVPKLQS